MEPVKQIALQPNFWEDERGWGVEPFKTVQHLPVFQENMHIVSLKPGAVRGNHYHTHSTEWILVFGGPARIVWKAREEGSAQEITVNDPEPALFEFSPGTEHAVVNDCEHDIYLFVFYDAEKSETVHCSSLIE
jgi:dTDP-4-dehydrorhamnose 3,5-epimerase-like enzyme